MTTLRLRHNAPAPALPSDPMARRAELERRIASADDQAAAWDAIGFARAAEGFRDESARWRTDLAAMPAPIQPEETP